MGLTAGVTSMQLKTTSHTRIIDAIQENQYVFNQHNFLNTYVLVMCEATAEKKSNLKLQFKDKANIFLL